MHGSNWWWVLFAIRHFCINYVLHAAAVVDGAVRLECSFFFACCVYITSFIAM